MKRIIIAAMGEDRLIGTGKGLPWHVPTEYQHFLDSVAGHTMIMGRKSWEIFGGDVSSTHNIIISRSAQCPGAEVAPSVPDALKLAAAAGKTAFIAGGGTIYQQALALNLVDEMHLSVIPGIFNGTIYFPDFCRRDWEIIDQQDRGAYVFYRYCRRA